MRGYKKLIKRLMEENVENRDDDRKLTLAVWQEYGFQLTPEQRALFMRIPKAEIITRRRREFRDLYPETDAVRESRYERAEEFKQELTPHAISWLNDD